MKTGGDSLEALPPAISNNLEQFTLRSPADGTSPTMVENMKVVAAILCALLLAAFVNAEDKPAASLLHLSTGEKAKFEYREFGCFGEYRECVGTIVRSTHDWKFAARQADSTRKFGRRVAGSLTKEEIAFWDAALRPKEYRDDDVILSGGFSGAITWSDGARQTLSGTGDDDRLARLIWKHFE